MTDDLLNPLMDRADIWDADRVKTLTGAGILFFQIYLFTHFLISSHFCSSCSMTHIFQQTTDDEPITEHSTTSPCYVTG